MVKFRIDSKVRELIRQHNADVQATIANIANSKSDQTSTTSHPTGRVVINNKEVCIKRDCIVDETAANPYQYCTKEEWLVLAALHETIQILKEDPSKLTRFVPLQELADI